MTPQKAMNDFNVAVAVYITCSSCSSPIVNVWSNAEYRPRFCHYCGQALDWSGEDENNTRIKTLPFLR